MRRWLVLSLGLGIAAAAGWALLTAGAPGPDDSARARPPEAGALDEIDPRSRERLEDILREAERDEEPGAGAAGTRGGERR